MRVLPSRLEPPPAGVPNGVWVGRPGLAELVRYEPQAGGESLLQTTASKSIPICSIVQWLVIKTLQISSFT
jgi:hypothetical protein